MKTERKLKWCIEQVEKAQNALLKINESDAVSSMVKWKVQLVNNSLRKATHHMRQMVGATSESIRAAAGIATADTTGQYVE